jgi:hypothetical protein
LFGRDSVPTLTVVRKGLFAFPNPVNEVSARLVAAGVVGMTVLFLATRWGWVLVPLAYGFLARVTTGPTLSPLGQLVTRVVTPSLDIAPRDVAGPPKRFAQGIGATLSIAAFVSYFVFGNTTVAVVLVALITVAASLEAFAGFCLGCKLFAVLMHVGVVPESVCEECNDIWRRIPVPAGR